MLEACFFFSSRRRHTRFDCDWSSDVCSSDLASEAVAPALAAVDKTAASVARRSAQSAACPSGFWQGGVGRAAGWGRGEISGVAGSFKKKKKKDAGLVLSPHKTD